MSAAARRARVDRVIAAGRRIADPRDPLGIEARRRLPEASGLSPEGVELALSEHLEVAPAEAALEALIAGAGRARRCHVVLASNVCTAPLRAIAVAAATAPDVLVRPSRRDPVVAELLVRALPEGARLEGRIAPAAGDELHVYGTDETVAALRAQAGAGVTVRGHGSGVGIAVVGAGVDIEAAARRIAADIVPFDQRGCLSPRIVLVENAAGSAEAGAARAGALARALHEALCLAGERVPRGPLDDAARAEIAMHRATLEAIGAWWEGPGHGVGLDPAPRSAMLPPAARIAHVAAASPEAIEGLLGPLARVIASVGADDAGPLTQAVLRLAPRARRARLGDMQRPPLDGPVDLRTTRGG